MDKQILRQIPIEQPFVPRMGMMKSDLSYFTFNTFNTEKLKFINSPYSFINSSQESLFAVNELKALFKFKFSLFDFDSDLLFLDQGLRVKSESIYFPSMWDPQPKFNKTIEEAHAHVPGLNNQLGNTIRSFLERLPADSNTVFCRTNLGITQTSELNQHPLRNLPRITNVDDCYVRIENQGFLKLAVSGYTVFGIKIDSMPLNKFCEHQEAVKGLYNTLDTMPDDMAEYKGLKQSRIKLLNKLKNYIEI